MTTILSYVPHWRYDSVPAFWRLLAQLGLGTGRGVAAVVADTARGMVSGRLVGNARGVCRQLAAWGGYNAVDGVSFAAASGVGASGLAAVSFLDIWNVGVGGVGG